MHQNKEFEYLIKNDRVFRSIALDHLNLSESDLIKNIQIKCSSFNRFLIYRKYDRVKKGVPIQYTSKKCFFYNNYFYVNKDVLIPRPETEILVETAVELVRNRSISNIIDIGTGSGCIIISIYAELKKILDIKDFQKINFYAVDLSPRALSVAKKNSKKMGCEIIFLKSDLLKSKSITKRFDLILANLPYLRPDYLEENSNLAHEPKLALDGKGNKGTNVIFKLIDMLEDYTKNNSNILLEIDPDQSGLVKNHFNKTKFRISIKKDLNNLDRVVIATKI